VLRIRQKLVSIRIATLIFRPRRKYLSRVRLLPPVQSVGDGIEVHMLLNHARVYEGMWAVYSFSHFTDHYCRIVIHDDGTLTHDDVNMLKRLFPDCRLISRATADMVVVPYLETRQLFRCLKWRQERPVALKLIDIGIMADDTEFVIIDSDVLFFARPDDLVDTLAGTELVPGMPRYSVDVASCYCLTDEELGTILGRECVSACNVGVLRTSAPDLTKIESFLALPAFWEHWWGEQTLWAMDLTLRDAVALPDSYATAPEKMPKGAISLHCCGSPGPRILYYRQALPRAEQVLCAPGASSTTHSSREDEHLTSVAH
jgi:hypothetical protein